LLQATRACERSGKRSGASRKSGGAERSGERAWQKTMERKRSVEREIAEQGLRGRLFAAHALFTCSAGDTEENSIQMSAERIG